MSVILPQLNQIVGINQMKNIGGIMDTNHGGIGSNLNLANIGSGIKGIKNGQTSKHL